MTIGLLCLGVSRFNPRLNASLQKLLAKVLVMSVYLPELNLMMRHFHEQAFHRRYF